MAFSKEEQLVLEVLADFDTTDTAGKMYQSILHSPTLPPRINAMKVLEELEKKGIVRCTERMVFFTLEGFHLANPRLSTLKGGSNMQLSLEQKKAARFRFLETLYKETNGAEEVLENMFDIGDKAGLDRETTSDIFDYLKGEGLVAAMAFGGIIKITHFGVVEYESAVGNPETPTQYFPPVNVVNNILNISGGVSGSQIQQGSISSQQNQQLTINDIAEIAKWITELDGKISEIGLAIDQQRAIRDESETVHALLGTKKPKRSFLKNSLNTIKSILEGVAGNAVAAMLLSQIPRI